LVAVAAPWRHCSGSLAATAVQQRQRRQCGSVVAAQRQVSSRARMATVRWQLSSGGGSGGGSGSTAAQRQPWQPQRQPCSVGSGGGLVAAAWWWQQRGSSSSSSTAVQRRPWWQWRQRQQLGDRALLATEEAWRVSQWQHCCRKYGGGSTAEAAAQWRWQCGGGSSVAVAALRWQQRGSGSRGAAAAAAREAQWAAQHQRSGSGCRRGPPFYNNNYTMEYG
jgi:hypothetical protein